MRHVARRARHRPGRLVRGGQVFAGDDGGCPAVRLEAGLAPRGADLRDKAAEIRGGMSKLGSGGLLAGLALVVDLPARLVLLPVDLALLALGDVTTGIARRGDVQRACNDKATESFYQGADWTSGLAGTLKARSKLDLAARVARSSV